MIPTKEIKALRAFHNCKCGCGELVKQKFSKNHDKRLSPMQYIEDSITGCWIWQLGKDQDGYGMTLGERAHRVFYKKEYGEIPKGIQVCHKCDNPSCVNPKHLFLGSQKDNVADMIAKGHFIRGEKHPSSKLSNSIVEAIRSKYKPKFITYRMLAGEYGVSVTLVYNIIKNKCWNY